MFTCRECEEPINQASEICPYCGADLTAQAVSEPGDARKKPKLARTLMMWGVVLAVIAGIGWLAVPWRMGGSKAGGETRAREAIETVQKALGQYRASEGAYPDSLEALGGAAREAAQQAQAVRYTLQFTAGPRDSAGRVGTYTLMARAGNFGYLNFYTDETGVLRATAEDRAATAQDAPFRESR
jgi:type II secretory pathway pseudopilin PulG